jgi:hypothetical protein
MREPLKISVNLDGDLRTVDLGTTILLGSGRASDMRLSDPGVAPLHLRVSQEGDRIIAVALAPGVKVDGRELEVGESIDMTERELEIGGVRVVPATRTEEERPQRTESLARELMKKLLGTDADSPRTPQGEFVVEGGPANGQRRAFSRIEARMIIGRGESATWILLDPDLSRNHAAVERHAEGFRIYDMRSKNGTKVNGRPVGIGAPGVPLKDGAIITLGDTRIRFVDPSAAIVAEVEANLAAAARGVPGAITQTTPGHGRALDAASAAAAKAADHRRLELGARIAMVLAIGVAFVAAALLVALLATS